MKTLPCTVQRLVCFVLSGDRCDLCSTLKLDRWLKAGKAVSKVYLRYPVSRVRSSQTWQINRHLDCLSCQAIIETKINIKGLSIRFFHFLDLNWLWGLRSTVWSLLSGFGCWHCMSIASLRPWYKERLQEGPIEMRWLMFSCTFQNFV